MDNWHRWTFMTSIFLTKTFETVDCRTALPWRSVLPVGLKMTSDATNTELVTIIRGCLLQMVPQRSRVHFWHQICMCTQIFREFLCKYKNIKGTAQYWAKSAWTTKILGSYLGSTVNTVFFAGFSFLKRQNFVCVFNIFNLGFTL
jgi:hypothetical protein